MFNGWLSAWVSPPQTFFVKVPGAEDGISSFRTGINRKEREIILSLRALEKQDEKSALKDNALKNKEIEEASKSNIGDLIKAEMQDSEKSDD